MWSQIMLSVILNNHWEAVLESPSEDFELDCSMEEENLVNAIICIIGIICSGVKCILY